jgi:hypothetical protein
MKTLLVSLAGFLLAIEPQSEVDQALKEFREAYNKAGKDSAGRAAAARRLGKTPHLRTLSALSQLLNGDGTGHETHEVRIAAAETIGKSFGGIRGAWSPPANNAKLRDKKATDVRIASTRAIGEVGQFEGLRTLQALADDKPFEIAREAVEGLARIPDRSSVPLLVKLLREVERIPEDEILPGLPFHGLGWGGVIVDDAREEQRQRRAVLLGPTLSSLKKLTGQECADYKEYHRWWSTHSSTFKIAPRK